MKQFILFFKSEDWQITGFFPYTSLVCDSILAQNHNYKTDEHDFLDKIWKELWSKAEQLGCQDDNKIVLQITKPNKMKGYSSIDSIMYIGMYDGKISMGLGMWQDEWLRERNQYFPIK